MLDPIAFAVTELSQAGEARRATATLARQLGMDQADCGNAAIMAIEVANNLVNTRGKATSCCGL